MAIAGLQYDKERAGLQEHGGVRGELPFPPLEPGKQIVKQNHEEDSLQETNCSKPLHIH